MSHDAVLIHFLRGLVFGLGGATDEQHRSECFDKYAFHSRWSRSRLDYVSVFYFQFIDLASGWLVRHSIGICGRVRG